MYQQVWLENKKEELQEDQVWENGAKCLWDHVQVSIICLLHQQDKILMHLTSIKLKLTLMILMEWLLYNKKVQFQYKILKILLKQKMQL